MASRLPIVTVKKPSEVIYYTWTDKSLDVPFYRTFTRCLNGSWVDKKESNGLILSFLCFQHSLDARGVYADNSYKMVPVTLTAEVLEDIETTHLAKPYKDEFLGAVNLAILYLVMGKNVGPEFRSRWAQVRAQSLYKIMEEEWRPGFEDQLITEEWARRMDRIWDNSRVLREGTQTTILMASRAQVPDHRYYQYLVIMLRYARITGLYLIREFLVQDKVHPILEDAYLQSDRAKLREAILLWLKVPMSLRPYLGILANDAAFSILGGEHLRRLTYIAVQVGLRSVSTLEQYVVTVPPDHANLDDLINQYFPPPEQERKKKLAPVAGELPTVDVAPGLELGAIYELEYAFTHGL